MEIYKNELNINELENKINYNNRQSELKTMRLIEKIFSGQGIIIDNRRMENMSVTEFVYLINFINDDNIAALIYHRFENKQFNRVFKEKIHETLRLDNDLAENAIERICFWENGFNEMVQGIQQEQHTVQTARGTVPKQDEQAVAEIIPGIESVYLYYSQFKTDLPLLMKHQYLVFRK